MKRKLIKRNKQYLSSQMKPYSGDINIRLSWQRLRLYKMYICPVTGELYKRKAKYKYMWTINRKIIKEMFG